MLRARSVLLVLLASGCLVDVTGDVRQSGGAPSGGSSAGGESVVNGGASAGGAAAGGAAAGGGGASAGGAAAGGAGGGPVAQHCNPGEFVTNITNGVISCTPVADLATEALASSCSVYYGWRDNCSNNCLPTRSGKVSGSECEVSGLGDSTCKPFTLGSDVDVELFSVDIVGNIIGDDRLFAAIHCLPGSASASACGQDTLVTSYDGTTTTCAPVSGAVLDYVRPGCGIVTGWRDTCSGCNMPPANYAWSTSTDCKVGGGSNSCAAAPLFEDTVQLQSIGLGGQVNDDDTFYVGLRCDDAVSTEAVATNACPAGEFVVGIEANGALNCLGLAESAMTAFRERCSLYFAWNGECDTCDDPPTKWGRTRDGNCMTSGAPDDTCSTMTLGNQTVNLYGLNTDGTVDGQDTFRIGFRCE